MNMRLELRKFARDSGYNFIRQGWTIVLGILISILITRGLGRDNRGMYDMSIFLGSILSTFLNLGIGPATVYLVGRKSDDFSDIVRTNFALATWLSLGAVLIGLALVLGFGNTLFPGIPTSLLLISLFTVPLSFHQTFLLNTFQGLQDFRTYNLIQMSPQIVVAGMLVLLVWVLPGGVAGALAAYISGLITSTGLSFWIIRKRITPKGMVSLRLGRKHERALINYGIRAHVGNILAFFNYRADVFILNILAGSVPVGLYSVAVGLAERLWLLPNAISTVLLPRIASLDGDESQRKVLTPMMSRYVFWASILTAIPAWFFAELVIVLLYSKDFTESAWALRALLPGTIFISVTKLLANDIAGRGFPGINSFQSFLSFILNVLINLFLIPRWGVVGVSLASTISYTFLGILKIITYHRITGVPASDLLILKRSDLSRLIRVIQIGKNRLWRMRHPDEAEPNSSRIQ